MNQQLKVIQINPTITGQSAKGNWSKTEIITEETDGRYPKKIAMTIWGDKIPLPTVGQTYDFYFDVESREHNGRWFTECRIWKYSQDQAAAAAATPEPVQTATEPQTDLPF